MNRVPAVIVKEQGKIVAVEVDEDSYVIPQEIGALLVTLGCSPSERETTPGLTRRTLDEYQAERR